jgi:hypothetical protein
MEMNLREQSLFRKIPVQEIFKQRILSKKTFYAHVKSGKLALYKLGNRSYVDAAEFDAAFIKHETLNTKNI